MLILKYFPACQINQNAWCFNPCFFDSISINTINKISEKTIKFLDCWRSCNFAFFNLWTLLKVSHATVWKNKYTHQNEWWLSKSKRNEKFVFLFFFNCIEGSHLLIGDWDKCLLMLVDECIKKENEIYLWNKYEETPHIISPRVIFTYKEFCKNIFC